MTATGVKAAPPSARTPRRVLDDALAVIALPLRGSRRPVGSAPMLSAARVTAGVLVAGYLGGLAPGLVATALAALAAAWFLGVPFPAFGVTSVPDALALTLFVLVGVMASGMTEALHRTRRRVLVSSSTQ